MAARNRVGLLNAAQRVQDAGRNGDTLLAHINPQEARLLDRVTDGASVNPRTGVLEFWDAGGSDADGGSGGSGPGGNGPDGGNGQGGGNGGGGNGGGDSDPGSGSDADVGGPSGPSGVGGLGSGNLGALSAATSDPDADPDADSEKGSGLAGISPGAVTAATPGVTPTAAEARAQADFGFGQTGSWGEDGKWGNPGYTGYAGLADKGFAPDGWVTIAGINYGSMFDEKTGKIENTLGFSPSRGLLSAGGMIPGIGPAISLGSTVASIAGQLPNDWSPMTGSPAQSAPPGSNGGDPNPYAEALGVDSADMQRRGLLNQRRTFTPIRM